MFTRVTLSTLMAAAFFAIPAARTTNGPVASTPAVHRTDDPVPCPECGPERSAFAQSVSLRTDKRADDPVPCPECGPEIARADDPVPCPECGPEIA